MSGEASWAFQKAVFEALTANANLMGAVSGVYDHVPADSAFPYVTIGETTVTDWSSKTFDGQVHSVTLHVWSRGAGTQGVEGDPGAHLRHAQRCCAEH